MGLPPIGKEVDEKALLLNVSLKENGVEPTGILYEGVPRLLSPNKLLCVGFLVDC
jgi:hypothetical protein